MYLTWLSFEENENHVKIKTPEKNTDTDLCSLLIIYNHSQCLLLINRSKSGIVQTEPYKVKREYNEKSKQNEKDIFSFVDPYCLRMYRAE